MTNSKIHDERIMLLCSGLYVLTDSDLRPDRSPEDVTLASIAGGATTIQLRERRFDTQTIVKLAKRLCGICQEANVLFIVNDRVDIALASGADGVHLGPDDMHPSDARKLMGPDAIIGVSVSSIEEAEPIAEFASYLGVGAIYGTKTKSDAGDAVGPARISLIHIAIPDLPIVAIGGIGLGNIVEVRMAGADAAAVVSAVICAEDMVLATRELSTIFRQGTQT